jgi:hypothetical protein
MTEVWNPSDLGLVESADTPALNALIHAYMERVNVLFPAITRAAELLEKPEAKTAMTEQLLSLGPMVEELKELGAWLYPTRRPLTTKETVSCVVQLERAGVESEAIQHMISGLKEIRAGRPHKRERCVEVFDLMLQSQRMSRRKAIQKLYPHLSTEDISRAHLEENIKAGIVSLKKVLREYAPELLAQYDRLHPDRAKREVNRNIR